MAVILSSGAGAVIRYSEPSATRRLVGVDVVLVVSTLLVAALGLIMVYTATSSSYGHTYLERQGLFLLLGIITMTVLAFVDYRRIELVGTVIYVLVLLSLLGVLVIGHSANGAARWINIGPLEVQPSEFAVLGLIVAVATYCSRRDEGLTWRDVFRLLLMAGLPILLVMKQPDLGTAIVMAVVLFVMLAVAGLPARILVMLVVGAVLLLLMAIKVGLLHHYQITRLASFLNQDSHSRSTQNLVYNVTQSKEAIGSGGLTGTGLFHGVQTKYGFVPEQQTDFIFSAIGEQLGFFGTTAVLLMLSLICWRLLRAAQIARDSFGRILCGGAFTFVAFSTFQNAGMNMGIMPVTGIPLPFISYGGSAAICFFAAVGVALSVHRHEARRRA